MRNEIFAWPVNENRVGSSCVVDTAVGDDRSYYCIFSNSCAEGCVYIYGVDEVGPRSSDGSGRKCWLLPWLRIHRNRMQSVKLMSSSSYLLREVLRMARNKYVSMLLTGSRIKEPVGKHEQHWRTQTRRKNKPPEQ